MQKTILRYPRLDTVMMVEKAIKDLDGEYTKFQLWKHLPKKMMYQTYCVIIDYLLEHRKISIDSVGTVGWIYNPGMVRKYAHRDDLDVPRQ